MNNSTTKHYTAELITSFNLESTARSNDINISSYEEIPKISKIPLLCIDLAFCQILSFLQCAQNT